MQLELAHQDFAERAVSPFHELGAYESLWDEQGASFKSIADLFAKRSGSIPSDFVERSRASAYSNDVHGRLADNASAQPFHNERYQPTRRRVSCSIRPSQARAQRLRPPALIWWRPYGALRPTMSRSAASAPIRRCRSLAGARKRSLRTPVPRAEPRHHFTTAP